ncbi:hypothetical protein J4G37_44335, partial [Microvirga sp. 3-52]|nr:hypothetical protein [Microvirga sp. 3-52]
HIDRLTESFGDDAVIGGLCFIETTLDDNGTIIQKSPIHHLVYGELTGKITPRIKALQSLFEGANAFFEPSETIKQDMWQKYLFITTLSGITSLMESPVGPIMEITNGRKTVESLLNEIATVMYKIGAPIEDTIVNDLVGKIGSMSYDMKSSMQRDMEKSLPLEADHLQGYLLYHAHKQNIPVPILET